MAKPNPTNNLMIHGPNPALPADQAPFVYVRNARAGWLEIPWQTNPSLVERLAELGGKASKDGWAFPDAETAALARAAVADDAKARGNLVSEAVPFAPGLTRIGRERWAALAGRLGTCERYLDEVDVRKADTKSMLGHVAATGIDKTLAGLLELDLDPRVIKAIHQQRRQLNRSERSEAA